MADSIFIMTAYLYLRAVQNRKASLQDLFWKRSHPPMLQRNGCFYLLYIKNVLSAYFVPVNVWRIMKDPWIKRQCPCNRVGAYNLQENENTKIFML